MWLETRVVCTKGTPTVHLKYLKSLIWAWRLWPDLGLVPFITDVHMQNALWETGSCFLCACAACGSDWAAGAVMSALSHRTRNSHFSVSQTNLPYFSRPRNWSCACIGKAGHELSTTAPLKAHMSVCSDVLTARQLSWNLVSKAEHCSSCVKQLHCQDES